MGAGEAFQRHRVSVRAEALTLARGERVLADGVSFAVGPGALLEVRGPNGAGKTTLLRILAGLLKPRAGRIVFENADEPALALHYLGHLNALKGALSAEAHLRFWSGLFGAARAEEALAQVGLERARDLPARVLSQGQQRRLALARLIAAPRALWLLDEPGAGLDTQGRALLADLIASHRAAGGVVIAALHDAPTSGADVLELGA